MGLAMIIAIKQFDMDRGQNVNMRVGIHTGKVRGCCTIYAAPYFHTLGNVRHGRYEALQVRRLLQ